MGMEGIMPPNTDFFNDSVRIVHGLMERAERKRAASSLLRIIHGPPRLDRSVRNGRREAQAKEQQPLRRGSLKRKRRSNRCAVEA